MSRLIAFLSGWRVIVDAQANGYRTRRTVIVHRATSRADALQWVRCYDRTTPVSVARYGRHVASRVPA